MVDLCKGSQQGLATLIDHLRAVAETISASAHKLSNVTAHARALCGTTDGRGWVRFSRALQDAGVATVVPMSTSVVVSPVADAFKSHHRDVHAVTLVRQPGWLPVTLGVRDDVGAAYESEARAGFATLGARVHWAVPCSCCGFTVEAAWLLQGLRDKLEVMLATDPRCFCRQRTERSGAIIVADVLWDLYANPLAARRQTFLASRADPDDVVEVAVHHWDPVMEETLRLSFHSAVTGADALGAGYAIAAEAPDVRILRSMYEFTRVPTTWNEKLLSARFDEIWVPGQVVKEAYMRSGIPETSLFIIPEAVDVDLYSPDGPSPRMELPIPPGEYNTLAGGGLERSQVAKLFKFCAVSKFEPRKGWDALFKAFFDAFDVHSGVSLHIRTYLTDAQQIKGAWSTVDSKAISQFIAFEYGVRKKLPPLEVITLHLTDEEMAGFFKGCDAFVLPSRGEGWGLPVLQAMSMGLPTITTNGSGMLAFATPDTAVLVDADLKRVPEAARKIYGLPYATEWFEPRHESLVAALKQVRSMPVKARRALGARARAHAVRNFSPSVVADTIAKRVVELEKRVRAKWAAQGAPPLQGGRELRRWNCTAKFSVTP
jgi:glycosyltransferase involved in cell wall biosynthesis